MWWSGDMTPSYSSVSSSLAHNVILCRIIILSQITKLLILVGVQINVPIL